VIDIHCHLMYGVDDGPSKIDESIRMISEAEKVGVRYIISTPHYHGDLFKAEHVREKYQKLVGRALDFGITVKCGFEVFLTDQASDYTNKENRLTLNASNYMLIEFPYREVPSYNFASLEDLKSRGVTPIISHPERCRYFIENTDVLEKITSKGGLIQIDVASILGVYGRNTKALAKKLLKGNKAHFVASNAHFADDYKDWYLKAYNRVRSWVGSEYTNSLFNNNAEVIMNYADKMILEEASV